MHKPTLEDQIRSLEAELDRERSLRESLQQELAAANQGLLSSLSSQKPFTVHFEDLVRQRTEEASRARAPAHAIQSGADEPDASVLVRLLEQFLWALKKGLRGQSFDI